MRSLWRLFVVVPFLAIAFGPAATSSAAEPAPQSASYEELTRRIKELEARLARLETPDGAASATRAAAAETSRVDRTVDAVLHDAERRSQLLTAGGATAGYERGFFIASDDGNFRLKPGLFLQFRGVANSRSDGDETESGFEVRRARLRIDGHFLSPDLTYGFIWDTARQGGVLSLLDAWAAYRFAPDWQFKVGQFRESWFREWDVTPAYQLAVERSMIATILGGAQTDRVQGVSLIYGGTKTQSVRAEFALHDGANSQNTDFRDGVGLSPNAANFGVGGRFEYKFSGDWANYIDFSARQNTQSLLVLGGGFDFTQRGDLDTTLVSADIQYESAFGLGLFASATGAFADTPDGFRKDFGLLAQAGYAFAPAWEVFVRYDALLLDSGFTADAVYSEFTSGVTYFFGGDGSAGHRAKITTDVTYLPDGAPRNLTGAGILAGNQRQFVLRVQFQLQI